MILDEELLPISGLQHLVFCERQCALIHVERLWEDNDLTVEGTAVHARVDTGTGSTDSNVKVLRSVPVRSDALRLFGVADTVEVGSDGTLHPVEYKHGRRAERLADAVQLCALAIALSETAQRGIVRGSIYYAGSRRRMTIELTTDLVSKTTTAAERFHQIMGTGYTPTVRVAPRCRRCSLRELCMPEATFNGARSTRYFENILTAQA
jgi:CRISPR-associated exonuclease Cas4